MMTPLVTPSLLHSECCVIIRDLVTPNRRFLVKFHLDRNEMAFKGYAISYKMNVHPCDRRLTNPIHALARLRTHLSAHLTHAAPPFRARIMAPRKFW